MFKESRSHDQMDAKNDTETQFRSRKLPLTRKIYAFYRAPIVKFWSNTVGRLKSMSNHLLWLFIREELSVRHYTLGGCSSLVFYFKKNDMKM